MTRVYWQRWKTLLRVHSAYEVGQTIVQQTAVRRSRVAKGVFWNFIAIYTYIPFLVLVDFSRFPSSRENSVVDISSSILCMHAQGSLRWLVEKNELFARFTIWKEIPSIQRNSLLEYYSLMRFPVFCLLFTRSLEIPGNKACAILAASKLY